MNGFDEALSRVSSLQQLKSRYFQFFFLLWKRAGVRESEGRELGLTAFLAALLLSLSLAGHTRAATIRECEESLELLRQAASGVGEACTARSCAAVQKAVQAGTVADKTCAAMPVSDAVPRMRELKRIEKKLAAGAKACGCQVKVEFDDFHVPLPKPGPAPGKGASPVCREKLALMAAAVKKSMESHDQAKLAAQKGSGLKKACLSSGVCPSMNHALLATGEAEKSCGSDPEGRDEFEFSQSLSLLGLASIGLECGCPVPGTGRK